VARIPKWASDHRKDVCEFGCVLKASSDRWHVVTYLGKGWFRGGVMRWRHGPSFERAQEWCDRVNADRAKWRQQQVQRNGRGFT
jgi:hypothetical protein